jgi:hypothetical protein
MGRRHDDKNESLLSCRLYRRNRTWHTRACKCSILPTAGLRVRRRARRRLRLPLRVSTPSSDEWMPAGVDGSGWKLRTLQRSGRCWLEHPEWMPTWLHSSGWKLRALPIWKIGRPLAAPILLRLALHRWRIRIFDFQPKRRAARAIDRAEPLRHVIQRKGHPVLKGEMWVADGLLTVTSNGTSWKFAAGWTGAAHATGIGRGASAWRTIKPPT